MARTKPIIDIRKTWRSFRYAWNGLLHFFGKENNAKVHAAAVLLVLIAAWFFHIDRYEWIAVCAAIALVLSAECINTAIERICDFVSPERREEIKIIKDMAAAAVLICALVAAVIGLLVFAPKIIDILS